VLGWDGSDVHVDIDGVGVGVDDEGVGVDGVALTAKVCGQALAVNKGRGCGH
jgi:hypothetical protein